MPPKPNSRRKPRPDAMWKNVIPPQPLTPTRGFVIKGSLANKPKKSRKPASTFDTPQWRRKIEQKARMPKRERDLMRALQEARNEASNVTIMAQVREDAMYEETHTTTWDELAQWVLDRRQDITRADAATRNLQSAYNAAGVTSIGCLVDWINDRKTTKADLDGGELDRLRGVNEQQRGEMYAQDAALKETQALFVEHNESMTATEAALGREVQDNSRLKDELRALKSAAEVVERQRDQLQTSLGLFTGEAKACPSSYIDDLERKVKALTEERDQARGSLLASKVVLHKAGLTDTAPSREEQAARIPRYGSTEGIHDTCQEILRHIRSHSSTLRPPMEGRESEGPGSIHDDVRAILRHMENHTAASLGMATNQRAMFAAMEQRLNGERPEPVEKTFDPMTGKVSDRKPKEIRSPYTLDGMPMHTFTGSIFNIHPTEEHGTFPMVFQHIDPQAQNVSMKVLGHWIFHTPTSEPFWYPPKGQPTPNC